MNRIIATFILLPLSLSLSMAQKNLLPDFLDQFREYQENTVREKVFLHLDKTQYATSETIWIKAYLVADSFHIPYNLSKNLYVELLTE